MTTAIRLPERTAVPPASTDDRPARFLRAAAPQRRLPAVAGSARERAAAGAYVVDPAAVAGALLDRLMAGDALDPRGRVGAPAC
jgi:hypothetical protein